MDKDRVTTVLVHELHDLQAALYGALIDSLRDASSGVLCVSLIHPLLEKLRGWKTRHGRAENNESNEYVGNAFFISGYIDIANPHGQSTFRSRRFYQFRINCLYRGYHPSRCPSSVHSGTDDCFMTADFCRRHLVEQSQGTNQAQLEAKRFAIRPSGTSRRPSRSGRRGCCQNQISLLSDTWDPRENTHRASSMA